MATEDLQKIQLQVTSQHHPVQPLNQYHSLKLHHRNHRLSLNDMRWAGCLTGGQALRSSPCRSCKNFSLVSLSFVVQHIQNGSRLLKGIMRPMYHIWIALLAMIKCDIPLSYNTVTFPCLEMQSS